MKKAIKLTLAVVFVMGATSLFAQQKFGRINTQEIIVGMPETKEMQTNMEAYAKDLQDIPENVKNGLEIVPVRWIDKVLEIALERMPTPLPDDEPLAATSAAAVPGAPAEPAIELGGSVKH